MNTHKVKLIGELTDADVFGIIQNLSEMPEKIRSIYKLVNSRLISLVQQIFDLEDMFILHEHIVQKYRAFLDNDQAEQFDKVICSLNIALGWCKMILFTLLEPEMKKVPNNALVELKKLMPKDRMKELVPALYNN